MNPKLALVLVLFVASAGTATAQSVWVVDQHNPVIGPVEPGSWWESFRWSEAVVNVDGVYHLFFTGSAATFLVDHAIGHATSVDSINWQMDPNNPVFVPAAEGAWQVNSYLSAAVIHDGYEFRMWYGGLDGQTCQVGYATSPDGSTWTSHPGNPVLEVGASGTFDAAWVSPAAVVVRGGLYHMWYTASDVYAITSTGTIGYATSVDGLTWTRYPAPVLESESDWDSLNVYGPWVVNGGKSFHMWYTGIAGSPFFVTGVEIGYATSLDGIDWTTDHDNPIDVLGERVSQPVVIFNPVTRIFEMLYTEEADATIRRATSVSENMQIPRRVTGRRSPSR